MTEERADQGGITPRHREMEPMYPGLSWVNRTTFCILE